MPTKLSLDTADRGAVGEGLRVSQINLGLSFPLKDWVCKIIPPVRASNFLEVWTCILNNRA